MCEVKCFSILILIFLAHRDAVGTPSPVPTSPSHAPLLIALGIQTLLTALVHGKEMLLGHQV